MQTYVCVIVVGCTKFAIKSLFVSDGSRLLELTEEARIHIIKSVSQTTLLKRTESRVAVEKILVSGADKSLARPTSQCIFLDGENISFDASLVIHINNTNIPPIMIISRIYETQNLLSL